MRTTFFELKNFLFVIESSWVWT